MKIESSNYLAEFHLEALKREDRIHLISVKTINILKIEQEQLTCD